MQKSRMRILSLICTLVCLLCSQGLFAQQKTITGTITDNKGETLIGVSVIAKGATTGTITDLDGKFSLAVPSNTNALIVKYIGMKDKEVSITGSVVDIVMEEDLAQLDEVVVIGYGTVKKKDLTGSVASVSSDAIAAVPVANVTEAITGKLAGVQISTTEGSPDAEMTIRVRGGGSITGDNSPLYIVDGFPVQSINDIASTDIESIDVLKDASSTAIYGSRGANGVILVTTKSGKSGKTNVSYNAYYSWKKIAKTLDVLDPADYVKWQYELAAINANNGDMSNYTDYFGNYEDMDLYNNVPYNDWQDLTFGRTGHTFNHNISITGGSDKIRYAFSYSHMNDKAIMEGSSFKRDNFSLKLNTNPAKNVGVDFSIRYSDTDIRGGGANDASTTLDTDKRLKYSVIYTPIPISNLTSESGNNSDDALGNLYNPLVAISDNDRKQERKNLNMSGSVYWDIFENFRVRAELGQDTNDNEDNRFWGPTTYYVRNSVLAEDQGKPAIRMVNSTRKSFRSTNTVNYDFKKFTGQDHSLNMMLGHEYVITTSKTLTDEVHGFPASFTASDAWKYTSQGNAASINNYYNPDDKLLSYFGRVNYNYQSKYLASVTFRADGSSKFGDGNRWGYFPSAALAWRVSSESFMEGTKSWLDDLKLRLSYGTAGNNNIPSGQITQPYATVTGKPWVNGFLYPLAPSVDMANSDLKWETTITRNIGLDYSFLGGRINGTFDAYLNTTKDLLIQFPIKGVGYTNQYRNMGKTQNKGFEATINWVAIDKKDFGLNLSANIGFNKNEIKSLGIMNDYGYETYWASSQIGYDYWIGVGGSVGQMIGYRSDGRYETSDFEGYDESSKKWILKDGVTNSSAVVGTIRPGSMKLKDLDGDGNVTTEDREIIGNANPTHTGGFSINARAYGFDLSANFNWSVGNDVYNANKIEFTQTGGYYYRNLISDMASGKRWTSLRADGTLSTDLDELAAMNANTTMWSPNTQRMVFSDWAVEDASFLRLNTLTLGYTFPKALVSKASIQSLRLYVTAYNVFCITDYSGYDPEVSTIRRTNLSPGVDYSAYPKSRQFVVGVNLNF